MECMSKLCFDMRKQSFRTPQILYTRQIIEGMTR